MRHTPLTLATILATSSFGFAANTAVDARWLNNFNFGSTGVLIDSASSPLEVGSNIQIGYFDPLQVAPGMDVSTFGQAQWDAFIPITGAGSNNPQFDTNVGADDGTGNLLAGLFDIGVTFDNVSDPTISEIPVGAATARLGLRIFDSADDSGNFNTVTSNESGWILQGLKDTPQTPASAILDNRVNEPGLGPQFNDGGFPLAWEDASSPFQTTIPEPSSTLLGLLGSLMLFRRRR